LAVRIAELVIEVDDADLERYLERLTTPATRHARLPGRTLANAVIGGPERWARRPISIEGKLVEAAGVEFGIRAINDFLMTRDFWC
jgi:hypothetical protein